MIEPPWDGRERRAGWSDIIIHVTEIRKDIGFIKDRFIEHQETFKEHGELDDRRFGDISRDLETLKQLKWKIIGGVFVVATLAQFMPSLVKAFNGGK